MRRVCRLRCCAPDVGVRLLHSSRVLQLRKKVVPLPAFFRPPSAAAAETTAAAALPPPSAPSGPPAQSSSSPAPASASIVSPSHTAGDAVATRGRVVRHFGHQNGSAGSRSEGRAPPSTIARSRRADDRADDASWDWKMGIIVERMPLVLNRQAALTATQPRSRGLQWEELQQREEERRALPIPAELRPSRPERDADEAESVLAPTLTAADAAGDLHSLDRSLNRALYLLVKRRNGHTGEERWTLPAVDYTALPAASVLPRAAAHSAVRAALGSDIVVHPLGNAPVAYHKYAYSQHYKLKANTGQQGCKLFLFHGLWCSGDVTLAAQAGSAASGSSYVEWAWASRAQLPSLLSHDVRLLELLDDVMLEDAQYVDESLSLQQLQRRTEQRTQHLLVPFRSRYIPPSQADQHLG